MKVIITMENPQFEALIRQAVERTLQREGITRDCAAEVLFVSLEEMKEINREQRGIDRPTDVLSFPMEESVEAAEADPETGAVFLGSMVLCVDKARAQAEEYGHTLEREIAFLTVHSVLHLLGYDHETGTKQETEMFQKQEEALAEMGLAR